MNLNQSIVALLIGSVVAVRRGMRAGVHIAVVGALRKNSRRVMVLVAGTTVILVGIIISPLPGPGFSLLGPIGLGIIATEFVWARRLIKLVEQNTTGFRGVADQLARKTSRTLAITIGISYWAIVGALAYATHGRVPVWLFWPIASILFSPIFYWIVQVFRLTKTSPQDADPSDVPQPSKVENDKPR
jgi:uncharacterized protein (TIGR02611 family)